MTAVAKKYIKLTQTASNSEPLIEDSSNDSGFEHLCESKSNKTTAQLLPTFSLSALSLSSIQDKSVDQQTTHVIQFEEDKNHGIKKSGQLIKKCEGKSRRCCITADGFLDIYRKNESNAPTRVNLFTSRIELVAHDKRCFDVISGKEIMNQFDVFIETMFLYCHIGKRSYRFQAEDESDQRSWIDVCKGFHIVQQSSSVDSNGEESINPSAQYSSENLKEPETTLVVTKSSNGSTRVFEKYKQKTKKISYAKLIRWNCSYCTTQNVQVFIFVRIPLSFTESDPNLFADVMEMC